MITIESKLTKEAREQKACGILRDGMTAGELVALAFTPQGQEFCVRRGFPSVDDLRALGASEGANNEEQLLVVDRRVYVNPSGVRNFAFAGPECEAEVVCGEMDAAYTILVFHGARVTIHAYGYAVVKVVEIGEGCKVNFLNYEKAVML